MVSDASEDHCYIEFIMPQTFHAFCADLLRHLKLYNLVTKTESSADKKAYKLCYSKYINSNV